MSDVINKFYTQLPLNLIPIGELFDQEQFFYQVPDEWYVIITDIRSSTQALLDEQHQFVNLIATGSVVSVLNIAFSADITIPFFFGGDGATFLVPPSILDQSMTALSIFKKNTLSDFKLEVHTGAVSVKNIYEAGHELRIAKFKSSSIFAIPIVLGNGLNYAELVIKDKKYEIGSLDVPQTKVNLRGMLCRWDNIAPPNDNEEVVSLLVVAQDTTQQAVVFSQVLNQLDHIYGILQKRQPLTVSKLKLKTTFNKLNDESRGKFGSSKILFLLENWFSAMKGYFFLRSRNGKAYLENLVKMSDSLVVDGKINTIICGTEQQRKFLQKYLDELEEAGKIIYGLHISSATIMSCHVRNHNEDHIHCVDGAGGGYTQAARMLKDKISLIKK